MESPSTILSGASRQSA